MTNTHSLTQSNTTEINNFKKRQINATKELLYKTETDSDTANKLILTKGGRRAGINEEFGIKIYTLL